MIMRRGGVILLCGVVMLALGLFVCVGCDTAPAGGGGAADDGDHVDGGENGDDGGNGGAALDGATLYADNCAACHGADGAGPPDVQGLDAAALAAGLTSASHGAITLTEDEVAAIADFLAG